MDFSREINRFLQAKKDQAGSKAKKARKEHRFKDAAAAEAEYAVISGLAEELTAFINRCICQLHSNDK